jgi:hypothetical protein
MAITSWSEHVHNSTELNSYRGTVSRQILGSLYSARFSTVNCIGSLFAASKEALQ